MNHDWCKKNYKNIKKNKINFFTGVPDSVLKNLSKVISNYDKSKHIIATNEGSATSLGIGYYLSEKKIPAGLIKEFKFIE